MGEPEYPFFYRLLRYLTGVSVTVTDARPEHKPIDVEVEGMPLVDQEIVDLNLFWLIKAREFARENRQKAGLSYSVLTTSWLTI